MKKQWIASLTGLRGIAAYSVLFAHMINADFKVSSDIAFAVRLDHFAMSLFFVLSGFVIYLNYIDSINKPGGLVDFFISRFARLYPLYFIVVAVYLVLLQGTPHPAIATPLTIATYATLTQSWFNTQDAVFTATWSISTEWFFYIGFALLVLSGLLAKLRRAGSALVIFSFGSLALLCAVFVLHAASTSPEPAMIDHGLASAPAWYWFNHLSPYIRTLEFGVGMLTAMAFRTGGVKVGHCAGFAAIGWCLLVVLGGTNDQDFAADLLSNFIFAPALAMVLLYVCDETNLVAKLLSSPPMFLAGEISYSVYLLQFICHMIARQFIDLAFADVCATVIITTAVSIVSYRLIEAPARRLIRQHMTGLVGLRAVQSAGA